MIRILFQRERYKYDMTVVKQKLEDSPEFQVWCFSLSYRVANKPWKPWKALEQKLPLKETLGNPGNVIDLLKNFEINPQIIAQKKKNNNCTI